MHYRNSGQREYYGTASTLSHYSSFLEYFNEFSVPNTYKLLVKGGTRMKTKKRKIVMYLYGSTIMGSRYPLFYCDGGYHPLPGPYFPSKSDNYGYYILRRLRFKTMVNEVEGLALHFLQDCYPIRCVAEDILLKVKMSKYLIPESCRISGSFYTHMTVLGEFEDARFDIPTHIDKKDVITAIVHVGCIDEGGGSTLYYDGKTEDEPGSVCYSTPFQHGRVQIGVYN